MKFEFIGEKKEDETKSCTAFGYVFVRGEVVEVKDSLAIAKLKGNSHFKEVKNTPRPKKAEE